MTVIGLIVAINTGMLSWLLDGMLGLSWSGQVIALLKGESRGLVLLLLLDVYLEDVRPRRDSGVRARLSEIEANLKRLVPAAESPATLLRRSLESSYPSGSEDSFESIVEAVLPSRSIYTEVSVTIVLTPILARPDRYSYDLTLAFLAPLAQYAVAVTASSELQDRISASAGAIDDVLVCFREDEVKETAAALVAGAGRVVVTRRAPLGGLLEETVQFDWVEAEEASRLLTPIPITTDKAIAVVRARIPSEAREVSEVRYECASTQSLEDHHCFWTADRPMFVKTIAVDASRLGRECSLHPLMASRITSVATIGGLPHTFVLRPDAWLLRGQGVLLTWR